MNEQKGMSADDWSESAPETNPQEAALTLEALDQMIREFRALRTIKEDRAEALKSANAELDEAEEKLIKTLNAAGKKSYKLDGVGLVTVTVRTGFKIPADENAKTEFFNYITEKYGEDTLMGMLSIHSATLNKFATGEVGQGVMKIPGLGEPTVTEGLSLRKA